MVDIPLRSFEVDGKIDDTMIQVGKSIPMRDQSGNRMTGRITQVEKEMLTMDFNHPLAGADLHFNGKVVEIREATEDELQHGHVHSESSCQDCSDPDCHSKSC